MLNIKNIHKSFGEQKVLQALDMEFEQGKIHTLVGGNGTGKTTLFNLVTGFLKPDSGDILLNGKRIDKLSPVIINECGISRTFQDLRVIKQLTVKENILLSLKNNPGEKIFNSILPSCVYECQYLDNSISANNILKEMHLFHVKDYLAGEISYGQQKLLTIGCCIANDADLILLDEPIAGIDKDNYDIILQLIQKLKHIGKTIIQIEHNLDFIEKSTDYIWFLDSTNAIRFDTFSSFVNNQTVKESYLNYA